MDRDADVPATAVAVHAHRLTTGTTAAGLHLRLRSALRGA
jgi:hypothetical protein